MKIYTAEFECSTPSPRKFWTAPRSDIAIGVKISEKGEPLSGVTLTPDGGSPVQAESDKIAGYTVFKVNSGATGSVGYTAAAQGKSFRLTQIVTDSTVFEVNAEQGGLGDYATQAWVEDKLTAYATTEDLSGYATEDYVDQEVSVKADASALTAYATKAELTAYATEEYVGQEVSSKADAADLTAYATKQELTAYATEDYVAQEISSKADASALTAYATKQELTAYATEDYVDQEVSAKVEFYPADAAYVSSVKAVYEDQWAQISANQDAHTMYVVLSGDAPVNG